MQQPAEDMPLLVTIALCTHAEPGKPELVGVVSVTTFTGLWTAMRQATKSTLLRVQPHVLNTYVHGGARTSSPSHVHYILPSVFVDCAGLHSTLPMKMRCRETISSIYADGKYFSTTDAQTSSLESTLVPAHLAWVDQCYGPSDAPLIEIVEALGESYFTMLLTLFLWNR